jgi:hypothetical protein
MCTSFRQLQHRPRLPLQRRLVLQINLLILIQRQKGEAFKQTWKSHSGKRAGRSNFDVVECFETRAKLSTLLWW